MGKGTFLEIRFFDKDEDLGLFNIILGKASNDRYELKQNTKGKYYIYDFEDNENRLARSKTDIFDILDNMFLEQFYKNRYIDESGTEYFDNGLERLKKVLEDIKNN